MPMTEGIRPQLRRATPRAALACAVIVTTGLVTPALGADVPVLERSQLERSLVTDEARERYRDAYEQAARLNVEPDRNAAAGVARAPELATRLAALKGAVAKAQAKRKGEAAAEKRAEPSYGSPDSVGVSQSTLDAIAACESGGSPTVVDASGTYHGKYQFDVGTWAGVGGSGLPSAAPEAEQDYRAALLYSQAGSSPWPVCG